MRKTNIIYPNRTPNYPPLGALYLTDALEKQGIFACGEKDES